MADKHDAIAEAELAINRNTGAPQQRKPAKRTFTVERRQLFLDALVLTCNARISADHAGVATRTCYWHRLRDPVFAERWREAMDIGCDRLEEKLLEHGGAGEPLDVDPDRAEQAALPPPPFDFDRALAAVALYRKTHGGGSRRSGGRQTPVTAAETDAAIMALLGRVKARVDAASAPPPLLPMSPGTAEE